MFLIERLISIKAKKVTKLEKGSMKITKLKVRGILLDLDGTVVDSKEAYAEAAKIAFQKMGQKIPETETVIELPKRLEQNLSITDIINGSVTDFLNVYFQAYYSQTKEKTTPIPNAQIALRKLSQKAKLALITMRFVHKNQIIKELENFSLAKYFSYIITALDTHKPKPSPEALIKTVKALDVNMCDCVIAGDSVIDIRAGKAAGAKTVAVLSGLYSQKELAEEKPDLILKDITWLPNHVDSAD